MIEPIGRTALAAINLLIAQGADNHFSFRYSRQVDGVQTVVDLTGHTARGQVRSRAGGELWVELAITLGGAAGTIQIDLPATATEGADWNTRRSGAWDMELTDPDGGVVRFAAGTVTVSADVTRSE